MQKKRRGNLKSSLEILDDVKQVKPQQWRNAQHVENMTRNYLNKLGIEVPENRIKQFMDAYQEAIKNGSSADELIQKYSKNADQGTIKALKKFIPKWK